MEKGFVQEAFREFYKFTDEEGQIDLPSKGCRALYKEVLVTTLQLIIDFTV